MNPIERLRKKANLSRPALGGLVGVSPRTIWNWENKISEPSLTQGFRLAEIFGVGIEEINAPTSTETVEV